MADPRDAPDDTATKPQPPEAAGADALPPAVWITGLIVLVLLLLAVFGLD